jgi:hypothetical protein
MMEGGFYWGRHPGGKWQPVEVIDWPASPMLDLEGAVTVQLLDETTLWPVAEMEIGPKLEIPAELRDNQES